MKWYSRLLHIAALAGTVAFVWVGIVQQRNGPVILAFTDTHGLHTGDIPIIAIGVAVCFVLTVRLWKGTS